MTEGEGLKVRTDKTHVMRPGNQQKVTGLVVNGEDHPRAPRALRRKVRAMIHNLKTGKGLHNGDNLNHLTGLIAFIHMCDPQQGQHLLNQLRDACSNQ